MIDYVKNNYQNKYLIPIISTINRIYEEPNDELDETLSKEIIEQITTIEDIYTKYKNNKELDFEALSNEIETFVAPRK